MTYRHTAARCRSKRPHQGDYQQHRQRRTRQAARPDSWATTWGNTNCMASDSTDKEPRRSVCLWCAIRRLSARPVSVTRRCDCLAKRIIHPSLQGHIRQNIHHVGRWPEPSGYCGQGDL